LSVNMLHQYDITALIWIIVCINISKDRHIAEYTYLNEREYKAIH